jgi:hypothetical protein
MVWYIQNYWSIDKREMEKFCVDLKVLQRVPEGVSE